MSFKKSTLEPFQTILAPTVKTSNVQFYKKPSAGNKLGSAINAPFTRSGAGRKVIDAAGNLVDAAANVPAWTFPIGGSSAGCPYLSFLPSVENLLTRSEEFDDGDWTKTNTTITSDATTSPDGTANADTLVDDATNASHDVRQAPTISTATYTLGVFAKAGTLSWLKVFNGSGNAYFNISEGYKGTVTADSADIEDMGNGWYWCSITDSLSAGSPIMLIGMTTADNISNYSGDGTGTISIWGAMLKEGSYISPLDYVKTTTAAVTRSADGNIELDQVSEGISDGVKGSFLVQVYKEVSQTTGARGFGVGNVIIDGVIIRGVVNNWELRVGSTDEFNLETNAPLRRGKYLVIYDNDLETYAVYRNGFLIGSGNYSGAAPANLDKFLIITDGMSQFAVKLTCLTGTKLTASQAEAASSWPSFDLMVSDLGYS